MFSRCLSLDLSIDSLLDRKPPDPCGASIAPARYRLLSSLAAIVPKGTCRAYLVRGYHLVLAQRSTRTLPRALRLSFERKLFFRWKCSCSPSNASRSDRTSSIPPHIARHFLAAVDVTPIASSKNSTEGRFRSASNSKCDQPPESSIFCHVRKLLVAVRYSIRFARPLVLPNRGSTIRST